MSQLVAIRDAGRKAGEAARKRDWALVRHYTEWARKAIKLEATKEARQAASNAYATAYAEGT